MNHIFRGPKLIPEHQQKWYASNITGLFLSAYTPRMQVNDMMYVKNIQTSISPNFKKDNA